MGGPGTALNEVLGGKHLIDIVPFPKRPLLSFTSASNGCLRALGPDSESSSCGGSRPFDPWHSSAARVTAMRSWQRDFLFGTGSG